MLFLDNILNTLHALTFRIAQANCSHVWLFNFISTVVHLKLMNDKQHIAERYAYWVHPLMPQSPKDGRSIFSIDWKKTKEVW